MSNSKVRVDPLEIKWYSVTMSFLIMTIASYLVFFVFSILWGDYMETSIDELLGDGFVPAGLSSVWFIFAWAFIATIIIVFALQQRNYSYESRPVLVARGLWLSLNAGVFEEIIYRVLSFMTAMPLLVFFNTITFGFVKWFHVSVLIPVADFFTFHALHDQLVNNGWVFGAAIIYVAASFRDAHRYLGLLGWVNAWFFGMVMFYLMFNYGLLTAIAAHFLYDAIIFTIRGLATKEEDAIRSLARLIYQYGR